MAGKPNGVILYEGPSLLDGSPIVVIATGLLRSSTNSKTGGMIQTYIIRADIHPVEAANGGHDDAICGDCPLRPIIARARKAATGVSGPQCYVRKGTGVASVYRGYQRGIYPPATPAQVLEWSNGRPIRYGTYGDPAAAPLWIWDELAGKGRTGYTHQWRQTPELRHLVMASVGTADEALEAQKKGWRTFRVRGPLEPLLEREIACPAAAESGHRTTCERCGLCNGNPELTPSRLRTRANIAIIDHGPTAARKRG